MEALQILKNSKKLAEATKLHKGSYSHSRSPKHSLQKLLSAKQILDKIGYPKDRELYLENERLIGNYKEQLGIKELKLNTIGKEML